MSDTLTVKEACEHGHYLMHRLEKMPGSAGPTMSCPGGREIVLRTASVSDLYEKEGLGAMEVFVAISMGGGGA